MRIPLGDGNPGISLSRLPEELRARTWFIRAWDSGVIPERDFELFGGAVVMIEGLVHHYRSFASHHRKLAGFIAAMRKQLRRGSVAFVMGDDTLRGITAKERAAARACAHEAIAYINRLGQFYYFAKSARVNRASDLRRVAELIPIRMKFTAHRSIDMPRGEKEHVLRNQAFSFANNFFSAQGVEFEFYTEDSPFRFRLQEEHPVLMRECLAVLTHSYPLPRNVNKALASTPPAVTHRAASHRAPAGVVAHL